MATDFGSYLRTLRVYKNISRRELGEGLQLSESYIRNIEEGDAPAPKDDRLRLWLRLLGESSRFNEAIALRGSIKWDRHIVYHPRDPFNEHIDRLLDAYEEGTLTEADLALIQMIAPHVYEKL